ncbi:hypothetical protein M407DRAFT_242664 [Tulasnella calospora MUT 4182]|uniref:Uncharacterized protein n=1 Tax=Tulasnella calospora MUT 4182 TaxID=1051891 RepID=A0A0C3QE14_9AGAM|nr:hypothetical protein M407DRAFT_242664 [Tulasnella calospora MUT 4182]
MHLTLICSEHDGAPETIGEHALRTIDRTHCKWQSGFSLDGLKRQIPNRTASGLMTSQSRMEISWLDVRPCKKFPGRL